MSELLTEGPASAPQRTGGPLGTALCTTDPLITTICGCLWKTSSESGDVHRSNGGRVCRPHGTKQTSGRSAGVLAFIHSVHSCYGHDSRSIWLTSTQPSRRRGGGDNLPTVSRTAAAAVPHDRIQPNPGLTGGDAS